MSAISDTELIATINQLEAFNKATPWYRFADKFRYGVMITTLIEVVQWMHERPEQRSCGCAAHTNHHTN